MKTKVFKITGNHKSDFKAIKQAAAIIKKGGLVAFPTETVYGLGADALNTTAVKKIYKAKKRPSWDPLICHVDVVKKIIPLTSRLPKSFGKLSRKFMPGPLTLLLEKSSLVPNMVTAGTAKVSVRIPKDPVALALIKAVGGPVVAPSANLFGRTSPTSAGHVLEDLDGRIDAIIDAGPTRLGLESTVLDITQSPPVIYRPGGITREQIEKIIGPVVIYKRSNQKKSASPGTALKHYSPKARLILSAPEKQFLEQEAKKLKGLVGIMLPRGWDIVLPENAVIYNIGVWGNWKQIAARLFAGLRYLDNKKVNFIVCPMPQSQGLGAALSDRLTRAAHR